MSDDALEAFRRYQTRQGSRYDRAQGFSSFLTMWHLHCDIQDLAASSCIFLCGWQTGNTTACCQCHSAIRSYTHGSFDQPSVDLASITQDVNLAAVAACKVFRRLAQYPFQF